MKALPQLLAKARQALLAGDYDELQLLSQKIEKSLNARQPVSAHSLALIKALASQNLPLLQAAREGIKSADKQLQTIKNQSFSTYDQIGQRQKMPADSAAQPQRR